MIMRSISFPSSMQSAIKYRRCSVGRFRLPFTTAIHSSAVAVQRAVVPSFCGLLIKNVFFKTKSFPEQVGEGLRCTVRVFEQTKKRRGNQNDTSCSYHSDSHGAWQPDRIRSSPLARIEFKWFLFSCVPVFSAIVSTEIGKI